MSRVPRARAELAVHPVVLDDGQAVVLPDAFLAYVELLRWVDPEAFVGLTREIAAADAAPAAAAAAVHSRRARMLASLESVLSTAAGDTGESTRSPTDGSRAGRREPERPQRVIELPR